MDTFLTSLARTFLSPSSLIHQSPSPSFQALSSRWSDHDIKTPRAIIQPATEDDILKTVQLVVKHNIPFVPASGGHSPWSTIDGNGVVIDMGLYKGIDVLEGGMVRVRGGVLMEELQRELHQYQRFAVVGNGSTVGVIPFYINGGVSSYTPLIGYGCENMISARIITGDGQLVSVSESENPDLFWGVRGAGQFLGLVTEIVVRTYPFSLLSGHGRESRKGGNENEKGERVRGVHVFPVQKIDEVCAAVREVGRATEYLAVGQVMIAQAPPGLERQVLLVSSQVFGSREDAEVVLKPLTALGPVKKELVMASFENHSQHLDWTCAKGGMKRYIQIGVADGDMEKFKGLVKLHEELVRECPDAKMSAYAMDWSTAKVVEREVVDTAFGNRGFRAWFNVLSWYSDPVHNEYVGQMEDRAVKAMRDGVDEPEWLSYSNTTRGGPLEVRYKGEERIRKLKELKAEFDPRGQFTRQLL